jgi:hypothetical protein
MILQLQDLFVVQEMRCLLVGSCFTLLCTASVKYQYWSLACATSARFRQSLMLVCNSRASRSQDTCTKPTQCHSINSCASGQLSTACIAVATPQVGIAVVRDPSANVASLKDNRSPRTFELGDLTYITACDAR